jgi:hypothetical protein
MDMAPWRFGRDSPSAADQPAAAFAAEHSALNQFVNGRSDLAISADELAGVGEFLEAVSPRQQLAVIQHRPWLATERGVTVLRSLSSVSSTLQLHHLLPRITDGSEWLDLLLEAKVSPQRLRLPNE